MALNSVPSLYRKFAWAAGMIIVLAVLIHILLPLAVNSATIRSRILSQVNGWFPGEVDFRKIRPALLPWPHAVVTQGLLSQPDKFRIRFSKGIVYPQFWPLFFGQLKIDHLKVQDTDIIVFIPFLSSPAREITGGRSLRNLGRQARDTLTTAVHKLGLQAVRIEDGRLVLNRTGQGAIELSQVNLDAKAAGEQLALRLSGRSNVAKTFQFESRINLPTLDGTGQLNMFGLDTARLAALELVPNAVPVPVMVMDLEIDFQTQGLETFHADFQAKAPDGVIKNGSRQLTVRNFYLEGEAQWTTRQVQITFSHLQTSTPGIQLHGSATWSLTDRPVVIPTELVLNGIDLDVAQIRMGALQLAGDQQVVQGIFDILQGGRIPELTVSIKKPVADSEKMAPRFGLQGRLTDGRIVVPHDLLHLEAVSGQVVLEKGRLSAEHVGARLGDSLSHNGTLQMGLLDGTQAFILDTDIDADLSELAATLKKLVRSQETTDLLDRVPPVSGRATGRLKLGDSLGHITARIAASGHIDVLDASLNVSGTIDGLPSAETSIQLDLDGPAGSRAVEWLGRWGTVPAKLFPKAPITINRTQITRDPTGGLDLKGDFSCVAGLNMTVALKINQDGLDVSKLHLKDATSDAVIDVKQSRDRSTWKVGFKGYLDKSTADKLFQQNHVIQGWIKGDLKVDFQADSAVRTKIHGRLDSREITIPLGSRPPLNILDVSLEGHGSRFDIQAAEFKWQESTARVSGSGTFAAEALDLDLSFKTHTLDADKMMPGIKAEQSAHKAQPSNEKNALMLRGKVRVEADQMILGGYHFAPLQAVVNLEAGQTTVDVSAADLCGIAMPGQIRIDQDGLWIAVKPHAARVALRDTDQCLAGMPITERLEGTLSANGSIETHGQTGEALTRNLAGLLDLQISDGRIFNVGAAGLFTNLLSFISVNQLIEGSLPDLRKNEFQYKTLTSKLALKDGMLRIEEGVLKSNAVNIVGQGDYGLATKKLDLALLVSPLTTVDWVIERIPLIGNILQGTLVAIPVGVKGPVVDPTVVPLSPTAVGSRLGGILERTIKTPFRILSPLLKDNPKSGPRS